MKADEEIISSSFWCQNVRILQWRTDSNISFLVLEHPEKNADNQKKYDKLILSDLIFGTQVCINTMSYQTVVANELKFETRLYYINTKHIDSSFYFKSFVFTK